MDAPAKSFRDLKVYRAAREAAAQIYSLTKAFPNEERYALTDQIRRSSRAVKAMLAEAWARRRYKAAFINKIDEALGEANKTQSWLDDALMLPTWRKVSSKRSTSVTKPSEACCHV